MLLPSDIRPRSRPDRIVLYSHDTMGLGHMRRNLLIAQTLSVSDATVLLLCGSAQAGAFVIPPGVDCLSLPALHKAASGAYDARRLSLPLAEVVELRARSIQAAVAAFRPDLLVADNVPRGALGELEPTLEDLSARGVPSVLGLRDVLDDPVMVAREWSRARNEEAISEYYRAVWVYGDRALYDLAQECGFSSATRRKLRYLGYLDQRPRAAVASRAPLDSPAAGTFALCTVGGGQDGLHVAEAFARARGPSGARRVLVAGPDMDARSRQRLHAQAAEDPTLTVLDFVREPARLVERAGCLIAMGGYNTVCEALSFRKQALIVPRVSPRREQLIRAERLRDHGLLDLLHPDALSPEALTDWMAQHFGQAALGRVDLGGLDRLRHAASELLSVPAAARHWDARTAIGSAAH